MYSVNCKAMIIELQSQHVATSDVYRFLKSTQQPHFTAKQSSNINVTLYSTVSAKHEQGTPNAIEF